MTEELFGQVLEALPEHIAVLDRGGSILLTNRAWKAFAAQNGAARDPTVAVGANYLDVCRRASAADNRSAREALAGIAAVLAGREPVFRMRYPCHSPREERWFAMTVVPLGHRGAVVTHLNITRQFEAEAALRGSEQRLRQAMHAANAESFTIDLATGEAVVDANARDLLGLPQDAPVTLKSLTACVHADDRTALEIAFRNAIKTKAPKHIDVRVDREARAGLPHPPARWLACHVERKEGDSGDVLVGLVQDITGQKRREEQIRSLMQELNHRAKNILSLVQAVARQTARRSPEEFLVQFDERIQSLARAHDLIVKSDWTAVPVAGLITSELGHFSGLIGGRITLEGPPLMLSARATQKLGMAIHELATNAAKYGTLSNEAGRVHIVWQLDVNDDKGERFSLHWIESGGPPVETPTRRGFGSFVLSQMMEAALAASAVLHYEAAGLRWNMSCAASQVLETHASM